VTEAGRESVADFFVMRAMISIGASRYRRIINDCIERATRVTSARSQNVSIGTFQFADLLPLGIVELCARRLTPIIKVESPASFHRVCFWKIRTWNAVVVIENDQT